MLFPVKVHAKLCKGSMFSQIFSVRNQSKLFVLITPFLNHLGTLHIEALPSFLSLNTAFLCSCSAACFLRFFSRDTMRSDTENGSSSSVDPADSLLLWLGVVDFGPLPSTTQASKVHIMLHNVHMYYTL